MAPARTELTLARKLVLAAGVILCCCAVLAVMTYRDLSNIDFGNVTVYKEGVGPSYEETLAGGSD